MYLRDTLVESVVQDGGAILEPLLSALGGTSSPRARLIVAQVGTAHLLVELKGMCVGLAGFEVLQVKQQQGELFAEHDVFVIERELQDVL